MVRGHILISSVLIIVLCCSCGGNKKSSREQFDPTIWTEDFISENSDYISIPYTEYGGVKCIPVRINGAPATYDMIVDTGCSGVLISMKEAQYLAQSGLLSESDYRGNTLSSIADGSIVENMVFNIREMIIGNEIVCTNVEVTVSNSIQAPMLLGNGVFDRISEWTIDNESKTIKFKL